MTYDKEAAIKQFLKLLREVNEINERGIDNAGRQQQ